MEVDKVVILYRSVLHSRAIQIDSAVRLDELRVFATVAELMSFSRAAEQLGVARGHVSTVVQQLEVRVGARLLQRTTRSVRLTPDGELFLARCKELLIDAEQLQLMFQPTSSGLTGRLRIDMPARLACDVVIPALPEFLALHPQLEIGISTTDRRVDLVHEGFDCVLRVGELGHSELVARPLGALRMSNLASPEYLRVHGTPRRLADLAHHRVVHYTSALSPEGATWEYCDPANGTARTLPMRASINVNGTDAFIAAALAGLGLIQAPAFGTRAHVEAGTLVEVLPQFTASALPVSLLYASRRQIAPRVQAVMTWLSQVLTPYLAHPLRGR